MKRTTRHAPRITQHTIPPVNSRAACKLLVLLVVLSLILAPTAHAAVTLISFTATPENDRVVLRWETATEINSAGFFIRRSTEEQGSYERISPFIPAQGDSIIGATYAFQDEGVSDGGTYFYKLEAVDNDQSTELHGPVSATLQAPATATPTPTITPTASPTPTETLPPTITPTASGTASPTATSVAGQTPTQTPVVTPTPTSTATPTPSATPSHTPTLVPPDTWTPRPTATPLPTWTPRPTNTPADTPSEVGTTVPNTATPAHTPSSTATPSPSAPATGTPVPESGVQSAAVLATEPAPEMPTPSPPAVEPAAQETEPEPPTLSPPDQEVTATPDVAAAADVRQIQPTAPIPPASRPSEPAGYSETLIGGALALLGLVLAYSVFSFVRKSRTP